MYIIIPHIFKSIQPMTLKPILIFSAVAFLAINVNANANNTEIQSFGHYKKMIHKQMTTGVVNLQKTIPSANAYAVGATHKGLGEITIIDSKVWLDYGNDGLGNSSNIIPSDEQATLLALSVVKEWQTIEMPNGLSKLALFDTILKQAKENGLDVNHPFPFQLEGEFNQLSLHVIDGKNPKFEGHGNKQGFFIKALEERHNQLATVIGFYSADTQGVYTHPGESWHLHAVIRDENIGAHVDDISTNHVTLKLPK